MLIQLAVEVAVATWLIVNEPEAVAVIVVEGRMLTPWMPMPAAMPVGEVAQVSEKLGRIIDPVQSVTRSLDQVHEGMESQSQGARQIRAAMEKLRIDAGESAASLAVFSASLDELRRSIGELNAEAARFRT